MASVIDPILVAALSFLMGMASVSALLLIVSIVALMRAALLCDKNITVGGSDISATFDRGPEGGTSFFTSTKSGI